jgi:putative restriction endonuclease
VFTAGAATVGAAFSLADAAGRFGQSIAADPDTPDNGLALCTLHHRAFDAGALGLDAERRILMSQELTGGDVVARTLLALGGVRAREPTAEAAPSEAHMLWHREQVFRAPAR